MIRSAHGQAWAHKRAESGRIASVGTFLIVCIMPNIFCLDLVMYPSSPNFIAPSFLFLPPPSLHCPILPARCFFSRMSTSATAIAPSTLPSIALQLEGRETTLQIAAFQQDIHPASCAYCQKQWLKDEMVCFPAGSDPTDANNLNVHKDCWFAICLGHPLPTVGTSTGSMGKTASRGEIEAVHPEAVGKEVERLQTLHLSSPVFIKCFPVPGGLVVAHSEP